MIWAILFWISVYLVYHTYVRYPERMRRKANEYEPESGGFDHWPRIDLLVAAYNEEQIIEEKIRSCLHTTYPPELIRVIIGSDCSSDQTDALINQWTKKDSRVRLHRFHERTGKPEIINVLAASSDADILVMSDADTLFNPETLIELIRPFSQRTVGGVQAHFTSVAEPGSDVAQQELAYNSRELEIKKGQSTEGLVIGAYGACYAVKRNLYQPVPKGFVVDDFYIFMKILEQDFETVYAEKATCTLEVSGQSKVEFKRKVRIGKGNYQNFFALKKFINPLSSRVSTHYWSYKALRWATPFLLIIIAFTNMMVMDRGPVFQLLGYSQIAVYALWPFEYVLKSFGIHVPVLRYLSHFMQMNLALLLGFIRFLQGNSQSTWR